MKHITTTVRAYGTHNAIRIKVNGKPVGWIQIEHDNLAFYGTHAKNSMSNIIYFDNPRGLTAVHHEDVEGHGLMVA